jgi:hypothetical protein
MSQHPNSRRRSGSSERLRAVKTAFMGALATLLGARSGVFTGRRRTGGVIAAALAFVLVAPFVSAVPAVLAADLLPVVIDLSKTTEAPIGGAAAAAADGVQFEFTITCVSNLADCVNLTLTDSFPEPLIFGAVTPNVDFTVSAAPNGFTVTFTQPLDEGGVGLVAGQTVVFSASGSVDPTVDASFDGVTVTNTAYAVVDNPDSNNQDSSNVLIEAPLVIQSTVSKTVTPSTLKAYPATPVAFVLGAQNTSNTSVDTLTIQDPIDPIGTPSTAFSYLEVTGLSGVTFPSGANRIQVDYFNGTAWIDGTAAATAALPAVAFSTIKGLRFTFSNSNPAVNIARDATAAVTINTETSAAVAALTTPFSSTNIATSQVIRDTDLGTIVSANAPFTINPAAISPIATKTFSDNDVLGGEDISATLTAQNGQDFELTSLSITEPQTATPDLAEQGLEFTGWNNASIVWPSGATALEVTYYRGTPGVADAPIPWTLAESQAAGGAVKIPAPVPTTDVTGFTVTFTGTLPVGTNATLVMGLHTAVVTDANPEVQTTNTIRVDATTASASASVTASDDLVRRNSRVNTTINKFFTPTSMFSTPGSATILSLQSRLDDLPTSPSDPGGSTVGITEFVVTDADQDFFNAFNATGILATEVPFGSQLTILYSTDGGVTYPNTLAGPISAGSTYSASIPLVIYEDLNGIRFVYTPVTGTLPPGFNVQPNVKAQLRSTDRTTLGPVLFVDADTGVPLPLPLVIDNLADIFVQNTIVNRSAVDSDNALVTVNPLRPGEGPGYNMIIKAWQENDPPLSTVQARSQDSRYADISWGTGAELYDSVIISDTPDDSTTEADNTVLDVSTTVYEAFDLTSISPITSTRDPLIRFDAVSNVEYLSATTKTWVPVPGNPCGGTACYGTLPLITLSSAVSADTIGIRLTYIENPNRAAAITAAAALSTSDPLYVPAYLAPEVGSGVAATSATNRDIRLNFRIRDTRRSDPSVAVLGSTRGALYNNGDPGVVDNSARIEGRDVADAIIYSDEATDDIQILDSSIGVDTTKTWVDGPLGIPPVLTDPNLYPTALMTVSAQNTSVVTVDELRIDEPTTISGPYSPFDYVNITRIEKLYPGDTTSMVTLTYAGGSTSAPMSIDAAVALNVAALANVVGFRMAQDRVAAGGFIGLQLHTQLRELLRGTTTVITPTTVTNRVQASVRDLAGTTDPTTTPYGAAPFNVEVAEAEATLVIEAWKYGVEVTKQIAATTTEFGTSTSTSVKGKSAIDGNAAVVGTATTPAIQYDNEEATASQAVITVTGQPVGNVRTTEMVLEDISPNFWNAYDLVSLDTSNLLADSRKQVRVDVLLGEGATWDGVAYTVTPGVAPLRNIAQTCVGDTDLSACWVTGHNAATLEFPIAGDGMPAGATLATIRGIRFTITNVDGSAWEQAYNPIITMRFTVDRRDTFVAPSGEAVPSTLSTYIVPAPGESAIGTFTDGVTVVAGAPLWSATATTAAEVTYQHLPARVKIKQSPDGPQSPGVDIPYRIVVTNTGGAYDKVLRDIVVTDTLPLDTNFAPELDQLVQGINSDTGLPYDLSSLISYRLANASNVTQSMPATPVGVQYLAAAGVTPATRDIVFTFPSDFTLPRGWTITISLRLQFRVGLDAGTPVPTSAVVTADQQFDTCEWFIDNAILAETPIADTTTCTSPTTVIPLASAPVTVVKGVRGVGAGPLDAAGDPILDSSGNPYDDLGILKTVPASAVTCDAPNVSVDTGPSEYYRYPCAPITRPGSIEEWAATFTNGGNIGLTKVVAIDVLPAPGDTGVIANQARGTKWTPTLRSYPVAIGLPAGATLQVEYLTDRAVATQRCNGADIQNELGMTATSDPPVVTGYQACLPATPTQIDDVENRNWQTLPVLPNDAPLYATVVALKFIMTTSGTGSTETLAPGSRFSITYQSRTAAFVESPETDPTEDRQSVAYSSIGAAAAGFDPNNGGVIVANRFVIEPRQVGVAMATGSVELRKTVTGAAASYSQGNFNILLTCISAGVSIPVVATAVPKNASAATVVHGLPLYADCAVSEDVGYNATTTSITPSSVIAQAPQTAGLEVIRDPNPVFGPTRAAVELSTVTNDYAVTTITISKTIDNSGALNGEGGTATAVIPNDLRFSINCTFNNGATTVTTFNQTNISLSNGGSFTTPASPGIPVGSVCSARETNTRGANSTTYVVTANGVTGSSTNGLTASGITLGTGTNSVDFTNVYDVASLSITKVVTGSWYNATVAGGEAAHTVSPFTVTLTCTRQLNNSPAQNTYSASVVLDPTVVGGLTHTFSNIIRGSNCTLAEPDNSGATTVGFTSSATINGITGSVSRTITNTFSERSLNITKTVVTDAVDSGGDVVYLDAPYTVSVGCTFDGSQVYPAGYTANPVLTFTAAELGNAKTATKTLTSLPSGASCTVTETSATTNATDVIVGWTGTTASSVSAKTATFTLSSSLTNRATISNFYGVDHFTVVKSLEGDAAAQFGTGSYSILVECVAPGPITTYSGVINLPQPGGAMSYLIDTLATGSVCSAEETNFASTGADALVYKDGSGTVFDGTGVDASGADPRVVIENWYLTGAVEVSKTLLGVGATDFGAGPFEVTLSCTRDSTAVTLVDPVRIFDPTAIPAEMSTTFTGLPTGAVCNLRETDTGSATSSSISDGATTVSDVGAGFTFTVSTVTAGLLDDQLQPALEVSNTFDLAELTVSKDVISAARINNVGSDPVYYGTFAVTVDCTFNGYVVYADGYDATSPMENVALENGDVWTLTQLPFGAVCTIEETDTKGSVDPYIVTTRASAAPITSLGTSTVLTLETTNTAVLTNPYEVGSIELSKALVGAGVSAWGNEKFIVDVVCTLTDATSPTSPRETWNDTYEFQRNAISGLVLPASIALENIAAGSVCVITESGTGAANATEITVDSGTPVASTTASVAIAADDTHEVVVTNSFDLSEIDVNKVIIGPGKDLYGAGPFEVTITCTRVVNGTIVTIPDADIPGGPTRWLRDDTLPIAYVANYSGLPQGAECEIVETQHGGADEPGTVIEAGVGAEGPFVLGATASDVTVTNFFGDPTINVSKLFDGSPDAQALYGAGPFQVMLECTREVNGNTIRVPIPHAASTTNVNDDPYRTLDAGNGYAASYEFLPTFALCVMTETQTGGAISSVVSPNPADYVLLADGVFQLGADQSVGAVNVTNTFAFSNFSLTKRVIGTDAGPNLDKTFTVEISCELDVNGTMQTITIRDGEERTFRNGETVTWEELPAGAECIVTETGNGGASVVALSYGGSVMPASRVTLLSGDSTGVLSNSFLLAITGSEALPWILVGGQLFLVGLVLVLVGNRKRRGTESATA